MKRNLRLGMFALLALPLASCYAGDTASSTATKANDSPSRISSSVSTEPATRLTEEESQEVSFTAGRLLKHVAQARLATSLKEKNKAVANVDQALKLVAIIDQVLPHYSMKTQIKAGEHEYNDVEDVTPRYITVFDELSKVDLLAPVAQAKEEAKEKDAQPKKMAAPVVSQAELSYTTVRLDLPYTRQMLAQAKASLADNKVEDAGSALLAIQSQGVLVEFAEIDLPLEQAADNLKLAEEELLEGRRDAATTALHAAQDELERYKDQSGDNRAKEVKELQEEIEKLATEMNQGELSKQDSKKHASKAAELWQRMTKWFKKR